jgi:predicted DNA binding CopG/RHH family protein
MIAARLPRPLADAVGEYAAQKGMTVNDLIGELLAERVGMPYQEQEALPLTKSA